MKIIAFYLPQFHAIPENDAWWGKGFTEWTNVKKAKPLFKGHYQPRIPINSNYYNLLNDEVKQWQIELASKNGIYGFCFYHYWFGGKLMLEKPIEQFLRNKDLDFPFCLCWANPPWTKVWAKEGNSILLDQNYGNQHDWEEHIQYLLPFFRDRRYITDDNMPLLIIYEPSQIPCLEDMISYIRVRVTEEGFLGVKIAYQYYQSAEDDKKIRWLFDYVIEFQPIYALENLRNNLMKRTSSFARTITDYIYRITGKHLSDYLLRKIRISDYDMVWKSILEMQPKDEKSIPGAFVDWDNTPRRGYSGRVFVGGNPQKFEVYLTLQIERAKKIYKKDYLFITAWNEWAEGSYLEPDEKYKCEYLHAIKRALRTDNPENSNE